MANKTLILWIDACRYDYIRQMPFLSSLAQKGNFSYLKPVFGYNSILASFMTGLYPVSHGQFTAYCLDDTKPKVGQDRILKFLPDFIASYYFNLRRYLQRNDFFVPYVPYKYSKNFNIAQDKFYHHPNLYLTKTLLDILDDNKLKFIFYNWPFIYKNKGSTELIPSFRNKDVCRVKYFCKSINKKDFDVYFLHLWDLDKYGHQLGPDFHQMAGKLKEEDKLIKEVLKNFSWEKDNIIIWSDHGMLPLVRSIDIMSRLPISSQYSFFIDSTMVRFWFNDSQIKNQVLDILNKFSSYGHLLSEEEKDSFKINFSDTKFGEEIFLVNPGVLILPNFFQQNLIKGMHGYNLSDKNEWGIYISNCSIVDKIEVVNLLSIILRILNIKDPRL
jgi:predicted AlkP superfamily pyrophosphatase or phosphodiesterase